MPLVEGLSVAVRALGSAFGVALGIRDRSVRLHVVPAAFFLAFHDGAQKPGGLSVAVTNLSAFAVTLEEVGVELRDRRHVVLPHAATTRGRGLPLRLEPRESVSVLWPLEALDPSWARFAVTAYARTQCDHVACGTSPSFQQIAEMAAEIVREHTGVG